MDGAAAGGVLFEYVGPTGLTTRGPRTGRTYRFGAQGAVVEVDRRDVEALELIPRLRRVDRAGG